MPRLSATGTWRRRRAVSRRRHSSRLVTQAGPGWDIDALAALELSSALSLALATFAALLMRRGAGAAWAAAVSAGLGMSLSFWRLATDGEVYAAAALLLFLASWALLVASPARLWSAARAGAAAGVAVLGHQWNSVLVLGAPLWLWGRRDRAHARPDQL
jgi:hypothetical protein